MKTEVLKVQITPENKVSGGSGSISMHIFANQTSVDLFFRIFNNSFRNEMRCKNTAAVQ